MIYTMKPNDVCTHSRQDSGSGSSNSGSGRFRNFLTRPKAAAVMIDAVTPTTASTQRATIKSDASIDLSSKSKNDINKPSLVIRASSSIVPTTTTTSGPRVLRKAANDFDDDPAIPASPNNTPPKKIWEGAYGKFLRSGGGTERGQSGGNKPEASPNTSSPSSNASLSRSSSPPDYSGSIGKKSSFSLIPGSKRLVTSSKTNLPQLGGTLPQQHPHYQLQHQQESHLPSTPEGHSATIDVAKDTAVLPFPNLPLSPRSNRISHLHPPHHNNHDVPNLNPTNATRGEDTSVRGGKLFKTVFSRAISTGSAAGASSHGNLEETVRGRHRSHQSMDALDVPMRRGIEKASSTSPEYHTRIQGSVVGSMPPPPPTLPPPTGFTGHLPGKTTTPRTTTDKQLERATSSISSNEHDEQVGDSSEHPPHTPTLDELLASASSTPTSQHHKRDWIVATPAQQQQRSISMGGLIHPMMREGVSMMDSVASVPALRNLQPRGQHQYLHYGYSGYNPSHYQVQQHDQQGYYLNAHQNVNGHSSSNDWNLQMPGYSDQPNGLVRATSQTENHQQVGLNMDDSDNSQTHADDSQHSQPQQQQQQLQLQEQQKVDQQSHLPLLNVPNRGAPLGNTVENPVYGDLSKLASTSAALSLPEQLRNGHDRYLPPPPPDIKKAFTNFHNASQFARDSTSAFLGADHASSERDLTGVLDSYVSYNAMLMRPGVVGNSVPYAGGAGLEKNLPATSSYWGSQSLPLDTVDEQNISIHKGMRLLKPIQGTESWQQGRRYLIAPAALASCPLPVINKLSGSVVFSAKDAASGLALDANEEFGPAKPRSCFGVVDLGEVLMTYVGEKHHLSLGKWSACRLVLRQNYLFEYDVASTINGLPRGYCHLQHAVALPHQDFSDSLELNFYASPCAKSDQRVLMIRAQNREERDHWIACLNHAANLNIKDLWDYDETRPFGTGRYADVFPARRTADLSPDDVENVAFEDPDRSNCSKTLGKKDNLLKPYHTCALKIVNKNEFWRRVVKGRERADTLVRELAVQSTLTAKCTSVSTFLKIRGFFETADNVVFELEVLEGMDLFEHISSQGVLAEEDAGRIIRDVLLCLDAMNRVGLAHRDVKPANILMSNGKDGTTVKVGDFGMSTFVGVDGLVRGRCGTPGYVAPEILTAGTRSGYGNQVDIFSAGVTLYVMLSGYEPFYGETEKELIEANKVAQIDYPESDWGRVSSDARDLVERMLKVNFKERITAREALQHPWLAHLEKERRIPSESNGTLSDSSGSQRQAGLEHKEGICTLM